MVTLASCLFAFSMLSLAPESATSSPSSLRSTQPTPQYASGYGLSLSVGSTSGIGLGLRKHFASRWGFHVSGFSTLGKNGGFSDLGAQVMYTMIRKRVLRFYALLGAQLMYRFDQEYHVTHMDREGVPLTPSSLPTTLRYDKFRRENYTSMFGPGLGIELHPNPHFSWSFDIPLTVVLKSQSHRLRPESRFSHDLGVIPIPNMAFTFFY